MIFRNLSKYDIILASQSSRRQEMLQKLGIPFRIECQDVDELYPDGMHAELIAEYLAMLKANAFFSRMKENELVIAADTVVSLDNHVLGKPEGAEQATQMLRLLSGKKHTVITGVCLLSLEKADVFSARTDVWFKNLAEDEISYYIQTYKPFDKAGAYGIQEWIGLVGIRKIEGSYFNVVGLPVQKLCEHLAKF